MTARSWLAARGERVVGGVLAVDERLVNRFDPPATGPVNLARLPWHHRLEAAWPELRRELDALVAAGVELPATADLAGADQGAEGEWTSYLTYWFGQRIAPNADRLPATSALVESIPGVQIAGYTVLHAGTHLPLHQGPAKALRYQLGVRVPEPEGSCRLRIGDETITWSDGLSLAFDDRTHHEAWNDSTETRYVLFVQVGWPVGGWPGVVHQLVGRALGRLMQGIPRRATALDAALNAHATGGVTGPST